MMVSELFPIVMTNDLDRALTFYRDLLGGEVTYEFRGPDGEIGYVGIAMGTSHIGIGRDPTFTPAEGRRSISVWVYTDDCDRAVDRLRTGGVTVTDEPTDQPWGERTAHVLDPDGNEVIIASKG
jgi:lactoylglutathione lyase